MLRQIIRAGLILVLMATGVLYSGEAQACWSCSVDLCISTWSGFDDCEYHSRVIAGWPYQWCDMDGAACMYEPGGIPPV